MIRIFIADDHYLVREGFKKLIDRELGMKVIAEARDANEVLSAIPETEFDVMVLDINMPGKSGLDLLKDLKQIIPKVKVLILSIQPEDRFAIRALKMGAAGYITKESAPGELVKAIQNIIEAGGTRSL